MTDWFRTGVLLGSAFVGVVVITMALAAVVVPRPVTSTTNGEPSGAAAGSAAAAASSSPVAGLGGIGGTLTVTGDLEGTFTLLHESTDLGYALVGDDGRIGFEGNPLQVAQISYEGWSVYPEPDECTITPGDADHATGIGQAELVCTDLADIRDKGVISISGRVGLAADRLGMRGVPPSGGNVAVGDETWTFESAFMVLFAGPAVAGVAPENLVLLDESQAGVLWVSYDPEDHRIWVNAIGHEGERVDLPDDACSLQREVLGKPSPGTTTIDLTIRCPAVEVPGLGSVTIEGTVTIDEVEPFGG